MEHHTIDSVRRLADEELLKRTCELLGHSRRTEAELLAHLGEIDARRLYALFAVSSIFGYCTRVLHLSEHEAYMRITAARAARKHRVLLSMLADGRLHLTGVARLAPHLTAANCDRVLARATRRSMRELEELIAELVPLPDAPAVIRKLPDRRLVTERPLATADRPSPTADVPSPAADLPLAAAPRAGDRPSSSVSALSTASPELVSKRVDVTVSASGIATPWATGQPTPLGRWTVQPTAPGRYRVQFTAGTSLRDKLERLRALMPDCDLPAAIEVAVTEELARLEAKRFGAARTRGDGSGVRRCQTSPSPRDLSGGEASSAGRLAEAAASRSTSSASRRAPAAAPASGRRSSSSRHIPAAVRRAVWERDGGRCRHLDERGERCDATRRLEFHHRHPFGHGGAPTVENVCLMCRTHNRYLAEVDYGRKHLDRSRARSARMATAAPETRDCGLVLGGSPGVAVGENPAAGAEDAMATTDMTSVTEQEQGSDLVCERAGVRSCV